MTDEAGTPLPGSEAETKARLFAEWQQLQTMAIWEWFMRWVDEEKKAILVRFADNIPGGGKEYDGWAHDWWHHHGEIRGIDRVSKIPDKINRYFAEEMAAKKK